MVRTHFFSALSGRPLPDLGCQKCFRCGGNLYAGRGSTYAAIAPSSTFRTARSRHHGTARRAPTGHSRHPLPEELVAVHPPTETKAVGKSQARLRVNTRGRRPASDVPCSTMRFHKGRPGSPPDRDTLAAAKLHRSRSTSHIACCEHVDSAQAPQLTRLSRSHQHSRSLCPNPLERMKASAYQNSRSVT